MSRSNGIGGESGGESADLDPVPTTREPGSPCVWKAKTQGIEVSPDFFVFRPTLRAINVRFRTR